MIESGRRGKVVDHRTHHFLPRPRPSLRWCIRGRGCRARSFTPALATVAPSRIVCSGRGRFRCRGCAVCRRRSPSRRPIVAGPHKVGQAPVVCSESLLGPAGGQSSYSVAQSGLGSSCWQPAALESSGYPPAAAVSLMV
jgi:hypothetical protein